MTAVFRPEYLGRLTRRKSGRNRCEIDAKFFYSKCDFSFSFASNSREEVVLKSGITEHLQTPTIFFPTKEVISMFPGFASIYRDKHIEIDETYFDMCLALERPLNKGARYQEVSRLLEPIEKILNGKVKNENGKFKLSIPGQGNMEISLVAEGHRKLAMIAFLLANGSILENGILFWDEPETNLNPKLMVDLVSTLIELAAMGIQIFIASHSLFFIKELDLQLADPKTQVNSKWFSLDLTDDQDAVISQGHELSEIEPILSLDTEIEQSERFYEREMKERN